MFALELINTTYCLLHYKLVENKKKFTFLSRYVKMQKLHTFTIQYVKSIGQPIEGKPIDIPALKRGLFNELGCNPVDVVFEIQLFSQH